MKRVNNNFDSKNKDECKILKVEGNKDVSQKVSIQVISKGNIMKNGNDKSKIEINDKKSSSENVVKEEILYSDDEPSICIICGNIPCELITYKKDILRENDRIIHSNILHKKPNNEKRTI